MLFTTVVKRNVENDVQLTLNFLQHHPTHNLFNIEQCGGQQSVNNMLHLACGACGFHFHIHVLAHVTNEYLSVEDNYSILHLSNLNNTRNTKGPKHNFILPKVRTSMAKNSFNFSAAGSWNKVTRDIKESQSISAFLLKLKTYPRLCSKENFREPFGLPSILFKSPRPQSWSPE